MAKSPSVPTAFLLANWYSGATLLTLLLNKHPQIVTNGELFPGRSDGRVKNVQCSCGVKINECPFYRRAADHMWRGWGYDPALFRWMPVFSKNRRLNHVLANTRFLGPSKTSIRRLVPGVSSRLHSYMEAQEKLMANALQMLDGRTYLDGCKVIGRVELFLPDPSYAASPIILLVREPLSWCASWMAKRPRATLQNAIRTWIAYIRRALRLVNGFPESELHILRYEDLCSDPVSSLERVFQFIGVDYSEQVLSREVEVEHHVLGNQMRLHFDGEVRPARNRANELSREDRVRVRNSCQDVMDVVGY